MIVKQLDPAIRELQLIVETKLQLPTKYIYANAQEANNDLDLLQNATFPCFIHLADIDRSQYHIGVMGIMIRTIPIVGFMLDEVDQTTIDYISKDINPTITVMRSLVENMVWHLNHHEFSRFTDNGQGGVTDFVTESIRPKSDRHLMGVNVNFNWKMTEGLTGCHQ